MSYRLQMAGCMLLFAAVAGYGFWQFWIYGPTMPKLAPEFVRRLEVNPANPQGDHEFLCQTQYCNDNDHYVGIQTHFLYENRSHMMWGVPVSYARLKFIDGSTGSGGTHDSVKMHPPVQVGSNGATRHEGEGR